MKLGTRAKSHEATRILAYCDASLESEHFLPARTALAVPIHRYGSGARTGLGTISRQLRSQMASSAPHAHECDEYLVVVDGCYTLMIDGKRISLNHGDVAAGTRTIHTFGGHRAGRHHPPLERAAPLDSAAVPDRTTPRLAPHRFRSARESGTHELVVLRVRADPHPCDRICSRCAKSAIVVSHSNAEAIPPAL